MTTAILTSTSVNIGQAIAYQYPNASPTKDYTVTWDGTQFTLTAWNLPDPLPTSDEINNWYLAAVKQQTIATLRSGYTQTLLGGFQCTISNTQHTFGWQPDDKTNLELTQSAVDKGFLTFPILYSDIHGNPVTLSSQTDLTAIEQAATKFFSSQHQQLLNLITQVNSATTVSAVEAITWTPATY
jgi:hypothetical protein